MTTKFPLRPDLGYYAKIAARNLGYVAGQIELTSKCFQKCAMCESWRDDVSGVARGTFEFEKVRDLFGQLAAMPTFEHLALTGGDPQSWGPLGELLRWHVSCDRAFVLQINTALVRAVLDADVWRRAVRDVRVSLDGATRRTYQLMRGDDRDPAEVVRRMDDLNHPGMATNTCVTTKNIDEVEGIIDLLAGMKNKPRKAMFLAVIGDRDKAKDREERAFWRKYKGLREKFGTEYHGVRTSFAEDVPAVRKWCAGPEAEKVPCRVGSISFHIKATGDLFPCCLVGGEAIVTHPQFAVGNVHNTPIEELRKKYKPGLFYGDKALPCAKVCQWKQSAVNLLAHQAAGTTLAMP